MIAVTSSAHSAAVGVVLRLERRVGHAVTAKVVGDEPELVGEGALVLLGPAQVVLRPAVDEQDRRATCAAPLAHVQAQAAPARDGVDLLRSLSVYGRHLRLVDVDAIVGRTASRRPSGRAPYLAPRVCVSLPGAPSERDTRPMFVGRARELEELERVLDAAQAGRGRTVLVAGEAGIGKTRLAAEVAARARDARIRRPGRPLDRSRRHRAAVPTVRRSARPLLPREAGLAAACVRDRAGACSPIDADPVLLVLEDLHWADTSTLDLVVFLAHNLADQRVVLLGTHRESLGPVRRERAAL